MKKPNEKKTTEITRHRYALAINVQSLTLFAYYIFQLKIIIYERSTTKHTAREKRQE